ncbi:Centromere/kinetochore protein zw10 [Apophysomyces ossiformis]|uniref:Centromere/kinetochore protein zw10 n=1 Tax=Apophysomyces ossiformis TaxID=679940 RepID=A0A8H7EM79_9FUNG|nr:Centromere/kinetochore protein zw10 [Apophysomyces ossiformis]
MPPTDVVRETFISSILDEKSSDSILKSNNVSAEKLVSILEGLTTTSRVLHRQLFEDIYNNFEEFSSSYNGIKTLHKDVLILIEQASRFNAGDSAGCNNRQSTVAEVLLEYNTALDEATENQKAVYALETLKKLGEDTALAEQQLSSKSLQEATASVLGLNDSLTKLAKEESGVCRWQNVAAFRYLQSKAERLQEQLSQVLEECLDAAINYTYDQSSVISMRVFSTFKPKSACLQNTSIVEVLECFARLNLLPTQMGRLKRLIFKQIMQPLLGPETHFRIKLSDFKEDNGKGGLLQLLVDTSDPDENKQTQTMKKIQQVDEVFCFFFKYIFGSRNRDTHLTFLFGNLLLPETSQLLIQNWIAPSVPASSTDLVHFDRVAQVAEEFEHKCAHTYAMLSSEPESLLSGYTKKIDVHYAKKRQEKILLEARKIMLRKVYDTENAVEQIDHNQQSMTQHYQITQTPRLLTVILASTIDEAFHLAGTHPISAAKLINVVKDLLDLYRAMMSSFHRPRFFTYPASALVFRNDCYWLASQIVSDILSAETSQKFEELCFGLQEAAQRLRELGDAWYNFVMAQRIQIIQSILDKANGFIGINDDRSHGQFYDQIVERVVEEIRVFGSTIRAVMDETLFLDLLGRVADSALARIIRDIEDLADIGAEESHMIATTLNSFAQLVGVFDLPGRDANESFVSELVPNWQRFWLVKDILDMGLRDIMAAFHRGDLYALDKNELVGLICALFKDTEFRETSIQEIKTGTTVNQHRTLDTGMEAENSKLGPTPQKTSAFSLREQEITMDDEAKGWSDADEDLFVSEEKHPADEQAQVTRVIPQLSSLEMDISAEEDDGWGWGDADENLFEDDTGAKKEKLPPPGTSLPKAPISSIGIDEEDDGPGWGEADEDLFGAQS